MLAVEKILKYEKSLKNRAKRARKIFGAACCLPSFKRLGGGKGSRTAARCGSPKTCERPTQHKNRVYRQSEITIARLWLLK